MWLIVFLDVWRGILIINIFIKLVVSKIKGKIVKGFIIRLKRIELLWLGFSHKRKEEKRGRKRKSKKERNLEKRKRKEELESKRRGGWSEEPRFYSQGKRVDIQIHVGMVQKRGEDNSSPNPNSFISLGLGFRS
jgi:replication initiation and membrane attachment protein DnaB